jgi:hypothetical protein
MRLLKVKLEGIRRFEATDALLVADRLVAIVGPNEAGKTSLLRALDQIDRIDDPLPAAMGTRQCTVAPAISALFELDEADRAALAEIHDTDDLQRIWLVRSGSGTKWILEREPRRDLNPRRSLRPTLEALETHPGVQIARADPEHPLTQEGWDAVGALADVDQDSLTADGRASIEALADAIDAVDEPIEDPVAGEDAEGTEAERSEHDRLRVARADERKVAAKALRAVAAAEAKPRPCQQAVNILKGRLPSIIEFGDADRDLRTEYDLQEVDVAAPPAALANVAALAELDLTALRAAIETGDHGTVRLLRENANSHLADLFGQSYGQSDVCLQLDTDGFVVRLLVRSEGGEDVVELSERSAGFRWFVALVAFLARRHSERPLVLIDEIETHLHYAAQADVVDVLSRQRIADQVIYTTHSAGALPPDLGRGVRAVVPIAGRQRSQINNSFWTSGPGFTPLLFSLGASTLPFAIPRYLVVAEGASDAVLLPTLIREATGLPELPYRIAPGIANTPPEDLHKLDSEGGRVVYLVDGDAGGRTHMANLRGAGIDDARILDLQVLADYGVTPEDCVDPAVLVAAANQEGAPFWGDLALAPVDLPACGRSRAIADWCKSNGVPSPSKVRIAQSVVEASWGSLVGDSETATGTINLCSSQGGAWLRGLHEAVVSALGLGF